MSVLEEFAREVRSKQDDGYDAWDTGCEASCRLNELLNLILAEHVRCLRCGL